MYFSDGLNVCKNGISSFAKIEYSQQSYNNNRFCLCFCLLCVFKHKKESLIWIYQSNFASKENQNSTTKHKRWFLTASNLISAIKENAAIY